MGAWYDGEIFKIKLLAHPFFIPRFIRVYEQQRRKVFYCYGGSGRQYNRSVGG
jgi:hypothetical protein